MSGNTETDYINLNAMLSLIDENGKIPFEKDKEAARQYFRQHVNQNTVFFHSIEEKLKYLFDEGYYRKDIFDLYDAKFIKKLYKKAYDKKFRFPSFVGAYKFYTAYAMQTTDGSRYLERYEDRVVAVALTLANGNEIHAVELMDEIISGRYQPATPTFLNAGKIRGGEPVSCYLLLTSDSMESISRTITNALQLSKRGGGVGILLTDLREDGAPIKGIENMASGVVPVMKILEDSFSYANQLGARQGSGAVYLNVHHPDITTFLDTKRENADEKIRIKTLSLGVVIPDITMHLAAKNEPMYLFSPYDVEKEYGIPMSRISITEKYQEMVDNPNIRKKKISARKLLQDIAAIQAESGYPYILFEDTATASDLLNEKINMSNLCVSGDTTIITQFGRVSIKDVAGTKQTIWNGFEYSEVDVVQTGKDQELVEVSFDNGYKLKCTPYHKFYICEGVGNSMQIYEVRAKDLKPEDKLIKWDTPLIEGSKVLDKAYTNGIYSAIGWKLIATEDNDYRRIHLRKLRSDLFEHIEHPKEEWVKIGTDYVSEPIKNLQPKYFIPDETYTVKSRIDWLRGYSDAFSAIERWPCLRIFGLDYDFMLKISHMLQTLGIQSRVAPNEMIKFRDRPWVLHIPSMYVKVLVGLGFYSHREDITTQINKCLITTVDSEQCIKVKEINSISGLHDTFCFTEPLRNTGVFNGIMTGQCSEILQSNSPSEYNEDGSYKVVGKDISCNLGSLNIAKVMEHGDIGKTVEMAIRALSNVALDSNINCVPSIQKGNQDTLAVGLGQMNLHGFLAKNKIHFDSPEAVEFVSVYFAAIRYHAWKTSNILARETGKIFVGYETSKFASGEAFDKYVDKDWLPVSDKVAKLFKNITLPTKEDWKQLKSDVLEYGMYNAYTTAIAPTGSISYVSTATASLHPITKRIEVRKEGKMGRVYYPAPYMTNDNMEYYRDAFEIGPYALIDIYAAATEHTDQGISGTLFFNGDATTRDINKAQLYAFKKGLKTLYYIRIRQEAVKGTETQECISCSI